VKGIGNKCGIETVGQENERKWKGILNKQRTVADKIMKGKTVEEFKVIKNPFPC
jgi:hypothetical protein